jgi:alkanesulfonate monooxygenase
MPVEFISAINANRASDVDPAGGSGFDYEFARQYARALDEGGFDYTLVAYSSSWIDANQFAQFVANHTERLKPMLAHRPGVIFPTHAARAFATLDQISRGRLAIHIISGGQDAEQRREGDYLTKAGRYERADEYIQILRRAWNETEPFDHEGKHYRFEGFRSEIRPYQDAIPVSVGGSSEDAYRVGGQQGDIFGLWGEPLAETRQQIADVNAYADAAGRPRPRIWSPSARSSPPPTSWPGRRHTRRSGRYRRGTRSARRAATTRSRAPRCRRTSARSGCWPSPSAASGTTARCGPRR